MNSESGKVTPIKVLWLTSSYPRSEDDSASVFLRYLAEALAKQHINLQILAPDHPEVKASTDATAGIAIRHFRYFLPRRLQKLAYGSGILPNLRVQPWLLLQVPFFILSMFITATGILMRERPALIHAHWIFPQGAVAVLLGKLFRIPVVVTAHGGDAFALRANLLGTIKRWTIKNCRAWTSNTQATAIAVGPGLPKPHIIPMGIDYTKFASGNPLAVRSASESRKHVLLFVGRLVEKKGVADLLQAFALLSEALQNQTELWIIGDGVERDRLQALTTDLRIDEKVIFYGRLANSCLPDYYAAADVFIAPSITDSSGDTEGQGVILLEAMASGSAVISTRSGGVTEIIEHGTTGLLCNAGKPVEIKNAIKKLLLDKELNLQLSIDAKKVSEDYCWEKIATKFANLYLIECE